MSDTPVTSPLFMDRDTLLGNSPGDDGRGRLHVKVDNKNTEPIPVQSQAVAQTPVLANIAVPVADTELAHTLQANLKKILIKARGSSKVQFCFTSGESGSKFVTIPAGCSYLEDNLNISSGTLYFQLNRAGDVVEILEWT